jgi:hypothetical protein
MAQDAAMVKPAARASAALLKFCEDHGKSAEGLADLRACVKELKRGRQERAVEAFGRIPLGGMGTFADWLPEPKHPQETAEYVSSVFDALLFRFVHFMRLLEKKDVEDQRV